MVDWVSLKASTICFMHGNCGVDDVVGKEDGEGFVADDLFGLEDGVAEAEGLCLPGVSDAGELGDGSGDLEQRSFVLSSEIGFEFGAAVEVIFHGGLAAAGNDDDLVAAGGDGLFDSVLNERLVDEAEHLLRHGLGGRKEASAQSCGREDGFANFLGRHLSGENFLLALLACRINRSRVVRTHRNRATGKDAGWIRWVLRP